MTGLKRVLDDASNSEPFVVKRPKARTAISSPVPRWDETEREGATTLESSSPTSSSALSANEYTGSSSESTSDADDDSPDSSSGSGDRTPTTNAATIVTLPRTPKPNMSHRPLGGTGLLPRLSRFLPELAAANQALEAEAVQGGSRRRGLEDVEEGETYIEMDLGLGVLEERNDADVSSSSSSSSSSSGEASSNDEGAGLRPRTRRDVLRRLMGQKRKPSDANPKPTIQEVDDG
ncbi:MAG: hypothetical protein M1838_000804 [Thelocarpon superellum]|nr:MAG: hypothetical protein M1838_000804 [Thelocarpon superellum]